MYNLIQGFPPLLADLKGKLAWPELVRKNEADHALLMTVNSETNNINFSFTGSPEIIAKHLLNCIMLNEDLALAVLKDLSSDKSLIEGMLQNHSEN